jgi:hypothetical protein
MTTEVFDPTWVFPTIALAWLLSSPFMPGSALAAKRDQPDPLAGVAGLSHDLRLAHSRVERGEDAGDEFGAGGLGAFVVGPVGVREGFEGVHVGDVSTRPRPIARPGLLTGPALGRSVHPST